MQRHRQRRRAEASSPPCQRQRQGHAATPNRRSPQWHAATPSRRSPTPACISSLGRRQELGHPGGNPGANLKSISHRCYLFEEAFVWELTKETIHLPLACLQGGFRVQRGELTGIRLSGSYLRLIDSCITQLKAQGPSRTCNESKAEEEEVQSGELTGTRLSARTCRAPAGRTHAISRLCASLSLSPLSRLSLSPEPEPRRHTLRAPHIP